ncbi:MAG TPA: CobD/CbiB family protein [Azoarcus taiwanensis]|nr:CobD/CbiB family protein [Azoarcus taiwanensis]
MTYFALILALLAEQLRPLPVLRVVALLRRFVARVARRFDDGSAQGGRVAWWLVVPGGALGSLAAFYLLWAVSPLLAFVFNVGVLYLSMGFRHSGHCFTEIHLALSIGNIDRARAMLGQWRGGDYSHASSGEVARLAIEQSLLGAHRSVFGVVFWFVLLPGPCGAVMYRLACFLADEWGRRAGGQDDRFGEFARRAFEVIDWLPVRLTAIAFSVIGNFEDAIYCWRAQSMLWPHKASGILIASGAGALGVRLGMPVHESGRVIERPEMGVGGKADPAYMQGAAKLVWRVLVLYLLLLTLIGIAGWVGR